MRGNLSSSLKSHGTGAKLAESALLMVGAWALRRFAPTSESPFEALRRDPRDYRAKSVAPTALMVSHSMSWANFMISNWKSFREPKKMVVTAAAWTVTGAVLSTFLFGNRSVRSSAVARRSSQNIWPIIAWGLFATAESAYLASKNRDPKFSPHNLPVLH